MQPSDIRPIYIPQLEHARRPIDWRDAGHWLVVKGFRPIACYSGSHFATPRQVFDDFTARYVVDTCEMLGDPAECPSGAVPEWGETAGSGFAIFRNGQPRGAWVEQVGGGADPATFYEFPGWGCITLAGELAGSIDGYILPLPDGWPPRDELIASGAILERDDTPPANRLTIDVQTARERSIR